MGQPNYIQEDWQGFEDDGGIEASTSKTSGTNNTNWTQNVDENFRIRFVIQNTGNKAGSNVIFTLYSNYNGTGYIPVTTASSYVILSNDTQSIADHATTAQRIGDGTYDSNDSQGWDDGTTDNHTGICDVGINTEQEVEFSLQIVGADVANGNTVLFEVRESDGTQLNSYNTRPSITVSKTVTSNLSGVQTLSGLSQALDAEHVRVADATQTLSGVSQSASAKHVSKVNVEQTLSGISQTANVTTETDNNAAVVQTLSGISQAADLIHYTEATVVQTLSGLTQTADLDVDVEANAAQTLDGISQSADLQHVRVANTVQTLSGLTQSLDADVDVEANATQTLDGISQSLGATSSLANNADVVQTLSGLTQSADADVDIEANATQTLSSISQAADVKNVYDRYWVGDTDNDWNDDNNWALTSGGTGGAGVPTIEDDVYFDNQYTNANCTIDVATANAKSITFVDGGNYNGILNANGNNVNIGDGGLDCTGGSAATITLGNGTWTCAGDWDDTDIGTKNYNQSLVKLTGSGPATISSSISKGFYSLQFSGTYTCPTSMSTYRDFTIDESQQLSMTGGSLGCYSNSTVNTINGVLSMGTGRTVQFRGLGSSTTIGTNGSITGDGTALWQDNQTVTNNGDISCSNNYLRTSIISLSGTGVFGGTNWIIEGHTASTSLTIDSNLRFTATSVLFDADALGVYTVDNTGNYTLTFEGDLTLSESVGSLTWIEGTGTVKFSGSSSHNFTDNASVGSLGNVLVSKTGGVLGIASNMSCEDFTFDDGDLDVNGQTITCNGGLNVDGGSAGGRFWNGVDEDMANGKFVIGNASLSAGTIDGDSGQQLVIDNLDFDLQNSSTITATYCDIGTSDVTNGTGDATDPTNTDLTGNTNWDFGVAEASIVQLLSGVSQSADIDVDVEANTTQLLSGVSQSGVLESTIVSNADVVQLLSGLSQSLNSNVVATIQATQTLSGISQSADLDVDVEASAIQTLSGISQSLLSDAANTANVVQSLSGLSQSLAGDVEVATDVAQTLSGVSQAADIDVQANTNIVQSLSGVSQSADLDVDVEVNATQLLSGISQAADATSSEDNNAAVVQSLSGISQSVNAAVDIQANVVQSLAGLVQAAVTNIEIASTVTQTLSGINQTAALEGVVTSNADIVQSLSGLAQAAILKVEATGNVVQTLSGLTQSASASGFYVADIIQSLSGLVQSADVDADIAAEVIQTLSSLSQDALVVHIRNADIVQTLGGFSQSIVTEPTAPSLKIIDLDNEIVQLVTHNGVVKLVHTGSQRLFRST